jgi:hypothetical protein
MKPCALALGALVALGLAGCSKTTAVPEKAGSLTPVDVPGHPTATPLPDPDSNGGHVGRAPRRITVAQLKASIPIVTGRQWSQIDTLAPSLGKADYALVNAESIEANLVFAKFLEDGAREVCTNAAKDDLTRAQSARMLTPELSTTSTDFTALDDATIQANLKTLAVRFWGEPMADDEVATYTTSFKAIAVAAKAANKPQQAWGAICVAMMTDPRFFTY